jgi:serine/threonine protein kinase
LTEPQAIAHYLVDRELGRGAMGVVYLAHDTKLGRPVAIKSLPADIAADPARRERFEGEARTLAAINHPNIGSIYGLEHQDGSTYLVLEFVEGPTLTDRLREGPMDPGDAIDVARQVALGIDAAHQRGIIHRDLKPDNIKIRPDGVVKVLDFGIAMAGEVMREAASPNAGTIVAPTPVGTLSTRTGFIVGTPGYMSPEQARGKPVNKSTDLWALGCVLYECLTGQPAFGGESLADALASTLMGEPDLARLPPRTPARVLDLLRAAFQKDLRKRTMTLSEAADSLAAATLDLSGGPARITVSLADDGDWPADPGNLPAERPALIGRGYELDESRRLMSGSRLLTIAGPDGSGRGSIALAVAHQVRDQFKGGVWCVRLPALADPDVPGLTTAFVLGAKGGAGSPAEACARRIAARQVLLVLDGCRYAPTACATLAHDLLYACPNVRIIATAWSGLGLEGEQVLPTPPLRSGDGAEQVFLAAAKGVNPAVDEAEAGSFAPGIAKRLGGWPLALSLAGGMAGQTSPRQIAEQLEQRARHEGLPDSATVVQVHRLMAAWVLDVLPPAELAMVLQASAFVAPFSIRALAAVGGAKDSLARPDNDDPTGGPVTVRETRALTVIPKLAARGVVQVEGRVEDPLALRLVLPAPVRAAAAERLAETPAAAGAVMAGHRAYFAAAAEQASTRWAGPGGGAWLTRTEEQLPEMLHAAHAAGDDPAGPRLREWIAEFRRVRGLPGV